MAEEKTIYHLDLHESVSFKTTFGSNVEATRVPGGWIYCLEYPGFRQSPIVFVPFTTERLRKLSIRKEHAKASKQSPEKEVGEKDAD